MTPSNFVAPTQFTMRHNIMKKKIMKKRIGKKRVHQKRIAKKRAHSTHRTFQPPVQQKERSSEYNLDDKISGLPEDILGSIVSLLPLKEAAATSTLSRRWRYVWTCTKNLNFDVGEETLYGYYEIGEDRSKLARIRYVQWVNNVVNQHAGVTIDRFLVCYDVGYFAFSITRWIKFAMRNRVQILELNFLSTARFETCVIDRQLLSHRDVEVGLRSLKVLNLVGVNVDGEVIEYLLSNCPLLERLQVIFSSRLINLRVVGSPLLALKHLEIRFCTLIQSIEIYDAENLVSFYCHNLEIDRTIRLMIRNVPKLVDVYIHLYDDMFYYAYRVFTIFSCCLSQLQILHLDLSNESYMENPVYPMLKNLKELRVTLSPSDSLMLARLLPFMKVSPYLQKLMLMITKWYSDEEPEKFIKPAKCLHDNLKELEVFGYGGRPNEDELIVYFVENAVSLEKIIVNPFLFDKVPYTSTKPVKAEQTIARRHAIQHLQKKVPSTIDFRCL
ncbi:hypothetical protein FNV43_RR05634 [Rhamnella rubrinervis]|uniref:F-box domain-containing protein n=1 Tax=Rhamnella rubrinervis TaxID=2594499 RepID=A0A8K0HMG2_9ROSA|nr:hypothetical protein FNV43_RR05634 [Rhamnella rubrinervis]